MNLENSLLVVCKAIPFDSGGSAKVLRSLFENSKKEDNILFYGREPKTTINYRRLPLPYTFEISTLSDRPENGVVKLIKLLKSLIIGIKIIKSNNANAILGVYRDEASLILSWLMSLFTGLPFHVYITDLYAENYSSRIKKWLQAKIFQRANNIFCVNQGMQKIYQRKYNINAIVVPHCVNEISISANKSACNDPFTILFSGNIVYDRLDLLQKLVATLKNKPDYKVRLLCPHKEEFLIKHNLLASNVYYDYITNTTQMMKEISSSDLLYLPLTFEKQKDERSALQLESCLGTKSFDYMQSGVPILVQCPDNYLTYQYFAERDAAVLLNTDDTSTLFNTLESVRTKYENYRKYAKNAASCLLENDGEKAYRLLMKKIYNP